MNSEERKEYNKNYYSSHRVDLLAQCAEKKECELCKRIVSCSRLKAHQKTTLCQSNRSNYIHVNDLNMEIEKRVNEILNQKKEEPNPIINIDTVPPKYKSCECGSFFQNDKQGDYYHCKTKKHIKYLENKNKNIE